MGKIFMNGNPYSGPDTAAGIYYNNTSSGLSATDAQAAIDELAQADKQIDKKITQANEQITQANEQITQANEQIGLLSQVPVNNNLLCNSNFAIPVNQRGQTTYENTEHGLLYTIDRWCIWNSNIESVGYTGAYPKLIVNDGYITLTGTKRTDVGDDVQDAVWMYQPIAEIEGLYGTCTMSAMVNEKVYEKTFTTTEGMLESYDVGDGIFFGFEDRNGLALVAIGIQSISEVSSINIGWVKLETGPIASPYSLRLYEEELQLCQRYYKRCYLGSLVAHGFYAANNQVYFRHYFGNMRVAPTANLIGQQLTANDAGGTDNKFAVVSNGNHASGWNESEGAAYELSIHNKENVVVTVTLPSSISVTDMDYTMRFGPGSCIELDAEY